MKKIAISIFIIFLNYFAFSQATLPYSESFEEGFGIWQQLTNDYFDWTRNSGATPTDSTGPEAAQDGDWYIYIEATDHNNPPEYASIEAEFDFSNTTMPILSFYYNMYGEGTGNLRVFVYDGSQWTEVWNQFNDQGPQWHNAKVCLGDYAGLSSVKIKFTAETQYSELSDIALDNIQVVDFEIDTIYHNDVTCGGYQDGSITIEVEGGFSPYFYSIDDGVNYTEDVNLTHTFTNLNGGDYVVRVKDASNCMIYGGVQTIYEPPTPDIEVSTTDVEPCEYSNNGTITIDVSNGHEPYQYSINGFDGPFSNSNYFDNLASGEYHIAVKEATGCIADGGIVSINAPYKIQILDIEVNDVNTCYGDSTGSLKIYAGGGHAPLSYSIDEGNNFQDNNYFPDLPAGDYRFLIQDAAGCLDTSDYVTINQPTEVVITDVQFTDVDGCYGDKNGTITITAQGGTGSLEYSIDNGFVFQDTNFFQNLAAGDYHIIVRDQNDCRADGGQITISQPDKLVLDSVSKTDIVTCYGDQNGTITIYAHGGTGTIFYSIDNGNNFQTSNYFDGLAAGTYYPFIKDENNCIDTALPITLTQPSQLEIVSVNKQDVEDCYGNNSGYIQILAQNGTQPYQYSIDGGHTYQDDNTFFNLYAGVYQIAVKDNQGCSVIGDSIEITQPPQIVIDSAKTTDVSCAGQADGTIVVYAHGGTGNLKYSIDGGNTYPFDIGQIVSQPAGGYKIAVRDENYCSVLGDSLYIFQPDSLKIDSIAKKDVEGCYGDSTGEITIYVSGGTPPYMYSIDNGITFQDSAHFTNLPSRIDYIPFVKDANNCIVYSSPITIGQPPQLYINNITSTNVDTCHGVPAGTITVQASGGTGNKFYSIDNGQTFWDNNGFFQNLYAGTYHIKVKDENNCVADGWDITIYEPDTLVFDSVKTFDVICNGQSNGKIYIYASGGQPQLYYSIDGGNSFSPSSQFFNLQANSYNIVVKDNFNCRIDTTVVINQPPTLYLDTVYFTDVNTCFGDSTGTITIIAHGGVEPIYYTYTRIGTQPSTYYPNNVFDNVPAGSYYASIKDKNGCSLSSNAFTINQPSEVYLASYEATDITCYGLNDGTITLEGAGGNGVYEYTIDGGNTWVRNEGFFENLSAGNYNVNVRDSNLCEGRYFYTLAIDEPNQIEISNIFVDDPTCYNYNDAKIVVYPSGGTLPYYYSLNDGEFQENNTFDSLQFGIYWITVRDANGCTAYSDTITIENPPNLAQYEVEPTFGCSPLNVYFEGAYPNQAYYLWIFGDGDTAEYQTPHHVYYNFSEDTAIFKVTVIAYHGVCHDTNYLNIKVLPQPNLYFTVNPDTLIYPNSTVSIDLYTTEYEDYFWNFGDGQTFEGINPQTHTYDSCGIYTISLTAQNTFNCPDTAYRTVTITAVQPTADFNPVPQDGCVPLASSLTNTSTNAISYQWFVNDNFVSDQKNLDYIFEEDGTQKVVLKAYGYCGTEDEKTKFIEVYPSPVIDFDVSLDTAAVGQEIAFYNYSTDAIYFIWDFGDSTYSAENDPVHAYQQPGLYTVRLIGFSSNGCTDTLVKEKAIYITDEFFFKFPTAFAPNLGEPDGLFRPVYNLVKKAHIEIYDRFGQKIYETDDFKNMAWDGTRNGKKLPTDVYVWRVVGEYENGEYFEEVGQVLLLR